MKKKFVLASVLLLPLCLFCACTSKSEVSVSTEPEASASSVSEEVSEEVSEAVVVSAAEIVVSAGSSGRGSSAII